MLDHPVVLAGASSRGGHRINGRRSRSRATARRAAVDAVAATWTIGSEDDGPSSLSDLSQPTGWAARPRERATKAECGAGSAAAVPRSGAALDTEYY